MSLPEFEASLAVRSSDHMWFLIDDVGTMLACIRYVLESETVTEEDVSLLAFRVRIHKFVILDFLEFLDLRLYDRVGTIRIDTFGFNGLFYFGFSFLVYFDF